MPSELLADVAVRASIAGLDPVFTYRVPPHLRALARPGQLVWAPLRRQRVQGVVLDVYHAEGRAREAPAVFRPDPGAPADPEAPVIRDLIDLADPEATLTLAQMRLARWLSDYYRTPLYDALALMLPPGVAQEAEPTWRATPEGMQVELGVLPERERAVLYFLRQHGETRERELRQALRGSDAELREIYGALLERGLVVRGARLDRPRARPRVERLARLLVPPDQLEEAIAGLARAPKQQAVLQFLRDHGYELPEASPDAALADPPPRPYPLAALYEATGADSAAVRQLERRRLLELTTREVRRDPMAGDDVPPDVPPQLTPAQERVWRPIAAALDASVEFSVMSSELEDPQLNTQTSDSQLNPQHSKLNTEASDSQLNPQHSKLKTFLLHGVTGSGKTELYLRAIGRALRRGRQALVLVPEIALTAQLVRRFAARFPGRLAVLHSGLALGERYDEWRRLRRGEAMLAIGSRSAVFAPLPRLGLIIVDEEHEPSYKHDGAPRYHARDVAQRLAALTGSVLILGSATPSVESYAAARDGRVILLELAGRVGATSDTHGLPRTQTLPLPPVRIVDMRVELQKGNRSIFSRPLQEALAGALERGEQAILFLNRRGAAAFVMCRDCGHVIACPNCSSPLVVHYDNHEAEANHPSRPDPRPLTPDPLLICHSCNHRQLVPVHCPECWSPRIKSFGVGTQRVVEEVAALFPQARALRWDRDSVTRKGDHTRMLDAVLRREADVLVGTQMIAKGLDLPLVSVVGVVAADTGLHLPDFRAGERTFQLLTQVAGRAGRRSAGAQVILQTYTPDHYALLAAQEHDYKAFFAQEISFRRQTGYPPFSRLVRFVYASGNDERARKAAEDLAATIRDLAGRLGMEEWSVIGPAPAFFHRQRNRYRWHLLLRAADPAPLLAALRLPPGWSLDVDPVNVL